MSRLVSCFFQNTSESGAATLEEANEKTPSKVVSKIDMPESNPVLESLPPSISQKLATIPESTTDDKRETVEYETSEGNKVPGLESSEHPPPEIDESLVKLLDKLVLYLRIVHSLDYYSGAEYLYEDDMPNRCGIIHIRSPLPDKVNYEEGNDIHHNTAAFLIRPLGKTF